MINYSEYQCIWLHQRWNTITVWWWKCSSLSSILQQEHDSCWMQLSHLWQEIASHYSMLWTLKTQARMHIDWSCQVEYLSSSQVFNSKSIKSSWNFFEKVSSRVEKLNSRTWIELRSLIQQFDSTTRLNSTRY